MSFHEPAYIRLHPLSGHFVEVILENLKKIVCKIFAIRSMRKDLKINERLFSVAISNMN